MTEKEKYFVIIPAAGIGTRMDTLTPKQYLKIQGITVLEHTLKKFFNHSRIQKIVLVLNQNDQEWEKLSIYSPRIIITEGGNIRMQSVLHGLMALKSFANPNDWVLVHDAVRPCLTEHSLQSLIETLKEHPVGGILGIPVRDTLKKIDEKQNLVTLARENVWQAQTPQMFRYAILLEAIQNALDQSFDVTDEASAIEKMHYPYKIILGDLRNIKLTYPEDVALIKQFLAEAECV